MAYDTIIKEQKILRKSGDVFGRPGKVREVVVEIKRRKPSRKEGAK